MKEAEVFSLLPLWLINNLTRRRVRKWGSTMLESEWGSCWSLLDLRCWQLHSFLLSDSSSWQMLFMFQELVGLDQTWHWVNKTVGYSRNTDSSECISEPCEKMLIPDELPKSRPPVLVDVRERPLDKPESQPRGVLHSSQGQYGN